MNPKLSTAGTAPITEAEVRELVATWYQNLDVHAPLPELTPMLIEDGLTMVFPEMTVEGLAGFQQWYERVVNIFFDEVHTIKDIQLIPQDDRTQVKVVVKWEASRWFPPSPYSERIIADAYQTWEVMRSPVSHCPVIFTYTVDSLEYDDNSVRL
ncbi:hypothetical protein [Egbenema bharatensis]|uniref:hypothetical protein n=1 Tax=Egbenema bharatensis TaxID=3463334 RepID=UPI003A8644CF